LNFKKAGAADHQHPTKLGGGRKESVRGCRMLAKSDQAHARSRGAMLRLAIFEIAEMLLSCRRPLKSSGG
jgi:hypothetical protein